MSLFTVFVLATTISVSLQLNCGTNYTYVKEWDRNWCSVANCFYSELSNTCQECSACNQVFRTVSDGPMLQCQVEGRDHLCAPSEFTFSSFFEDKMALPICFVASLLFTSSISFMAYAYIFKPIYWLIKIKKTPRYTGGERLTKIERLKLYRNVAGKVKKIAKSLSIPIRDIMPVGDGRYSKEELSFRFLERLSNTETDIATITKTLCRFGYGELVCRIFTTEHLEETEVPAGHDMMESEVILNLCDGLYNHPDYARYQFEIAIKLGLETPEIDNCRSEGFLSKEAMQEIFVLKTQSFNYSFQYIQQVLQSAQIPKSLLDDAVANCPNNQC